MFLLAPGQNRRRNSASPASDATAFSRVRPFDGQPISPMTTGLVGYLACSSWNLSIE